jgi:hypothetical protein
MPHLHPPPPPHPNPQGVFIANQMSSRREGDSSISDLSDRPVVYTRITFNGGGSWQNIKVRPQRTARPRALRPQLRPWARRRLPGLPPPSFRVFLRSSLACRAAAPPRPHCPNKPCPFHAPTCPAHSQAPSKFNSPKCNRCGGSDKCYLHLHGASSWFFGSVQFPSVYSHPSAPGLLVGTGNVAAEGLGLEDGDGWVTPGAGRGAWLCGGALAQRGGSKWPPRSLLALPVAECTACGSEGPRLAPVTVLDACPGPVLQ